MSLRRRESQRAELEQEADVEGQRRAVREKEQQREKSSRGIWGYIAGSAPEYVPSPKKK